VVLALHVIFGAYGFWLPNDPRGSWSDFVRSWELSRFGPATHARTRRSLAHIEHDTALRLAAKKALQFPPVSFNGEQGRAVVHGFAEAVKKTSAVIYACSVLPEHVHMVVARHRYDIEQLVGQFKGEATKALLRSGLHPFRNMVVAGEAPSPWARKCWKVFLDDGPTIRHAVE
jgi:hypothetical protein